MKKLQLLLMLTASVLLVSCSDYDKYPFKDISDTTMEFYQSVIEKPEQAKQESFLNTFFERQKTLALEMYGKKLQTEISDGLGFEVVSNEAVLGEGWIKSDYLNIPMNFDLKVIDANAAYENINSLIPVFFDYEGNAVYAEFGISDEQPLKQELEDGNLTIDTDSIEEAIDVTPKRNNSYNVGQILHKGINIAIQSTSIPSLAKITKVSIEKYDFDKLNRIREQFREKDEELYNRLKVALSQLSDLKADRSPE